MKSIYIVRIALDFTEKRNPSLLGKGPKSPLVAGGVGAGRAFKPRGRAHRGGSAPTPCLGDASRPPRSRGPEPGAIACPAPVRTHRRRSPSPSSRHCRPRPLASAPAPGARAPSAARRRGPHPPRFQTRPELLLVGPRSYAPQIASLSRPAGFGHL